MSTELSEGDPEELVACPFDPVHLVRRKRLPYHIIKCGKNFNRKDFSVCPFNQRHVVPRGGMESHLLHCSDRGVVEREMLHTQRMNEGIISVQKGYTDVPVSTFVPPASSESWDDSNVVVDVTPRDGLFETTTKQNSIKEVAQPRESHVKEPPQPRMPVLTGAGGSEVFKLATTSQVNGSQSAPLSIVRGRGRGRGLAPSPPKTKMIGHSAVVSPPSSEGQVPSVGRGRGAALQMAIAQSTSVNEATSFSEADEKKKKERKLKKMLRQIVELEEKKEKGLTLDQDQLTKLSRKDDVIRNLQQMQI